MEKLRIETALQETESRMRFEQMLKAGFFSKDKDAVNYAGNYMYMGTTDGHAMFKHIMTRGYIKVNQLILFDI